MTSCITEIDALISRIEAMMEIKQETANEEVIETPDWAKEKETETKDCSCKNNDKTKKDKFPFEATKNRDNFEKYLLKNIDTIKEKGNDFLKDVRDKREMNLLHCACINECDELIEILIRKYHININEVDIDGYSPLFYSVNQWSNECVSKLLEFKPRLDLISKDCVIHATGFPIYICGGKTILHQAAETDSTECCKLILSYMKQYHYTKMIDILCKKDFNGMTAMDTARMQNKSEILGLLNDFIRNNTKTSEILKLLNDNIPNESERKQMKRDYHLKIRQRIKTDKDNKQKQEQMNITKHYKPKYSELFFQTKREFFPLELLDKTLLKLVKELKENDDIDIKLKIIDKYSKDPSNFLINPINGVYIVRVFSPNLCNKLLEESENYIKQSLYSKNSGLLPITRPNSMNSYGLVLNSIGMTKSWTYFIKEIVKPLADILIPPKLFKVSKYDDHEFNVEEKKENEWDFQSHHTFIIRYKQGEDINLGTHVDASAVTFNICLGKQGFEGANVYFHAIANSQDDLEKNNESYESPHPENGCKYCQYELFHKVGYAALHVGNYIHGAKNLTKGTRSNVVIWCKEYSK